MTASGPGSGASDVQPAEVRRQAVVAAHRHEGRRHEPHLRRPAQEGAAPEVHRACGAAVDDRAARDAPAGRRRSQRAPPRWPARCWRRARRAGRAGHRHRHDHHRQVELAELEVGVEHGPVVDERRHRAVDERPGVALADGGRAPAGDLERLDEVGHLLAGVELVLPVLRGVADHPHELVEGARPGRRVGGRHRRPGHDAHVRQLEDAQRQLGVAARAVASLAGLEVDGESGRPVDGVPRHRGGERVVVDGIAGAQDELAGSGRQGRLDELPGDPGDARLRVHAGPRIGQEGQGALAVEADAGLGQDAQARLVDLVPVRLAEEARRVPHPYRPFVACVVDAGRPVHEGVQGAFGRLVQRERPVGRQRLRDRAPRVVDNVGPARGLPAIPGVADAEAVDVPLAAVGGAPGRRPGQEVAARARPRRGRRRRPPPARRRCPGGGGGSAGRPRRRGAAARATARSSRRGAPGRRAGRARRASAGASRGRARRRPARPAGGRRCRPPTPGPGGGRSGPSRSSPRPGARARPPRRRSARCAAPSPRGRGRR